MIGERTLPLLALVAFGGLVILGRLAWIQIYEHELWATEAARLLHSGRLFPYERGRVVDTEGRVLARDKETYSLGLVYRHFRRGHPLGQIAHARSLLEGRAVSLQEARDTSGEWASELLVLTPRALEAFGDGEVAQLGSVYAPAVAGVDAAARARRAADVRFYIGRLLGLSFRQWLRLKKDQTRADLDTSYLELAAGFLARERAESVDVDGLYHDRMVEIERSIEALGRLGALLDWPDKDEYLARTPMERLVDELERSRRWVEDATASKLFAEAFEFVPGRLEPTTLLDCFDLSWIARILAWDEVRLAEWADTTRLGWLRSWRDGYALPHIVALLRLEVGGSGGPDDVLDHAATIFAPEGTLEDVLDGRREPVPWRELDELAIVSALPRAFATDFEVEELARTVLPVLDPLTREFDPPERQRWLLIDRLRHRVAKKDGVGDRLRLALAGRRRSDGELTFELVRQLVDDWELGLQRMLADALRRHITDADQRDLTSDRHLRLAGGLRERALERADFFLKDYGMRPRALIRGAPEYEVVALLTRFPERYPGFEARESHERVYPLFDGDGGRLASELIGAVSSADVFDLQRQRGAARRLRDLRNQPRRTRMEEEELTRLVGSVVLHDEKRGVSGIEGFWDRELRGRNGYREDWGLQEALESAEGRSNFRDPVDGEQVWLTLDLDLQRAAQRTLRDPEPVLEDPKYDFDWAANPVGAIVFAKVDGDVLAAASEPSDGSSIPTDLQGQRATLIERTLRQPTFQPPGSCFKSFVAAFALDQSDFDPDQEVVCGPIERGGYGYVDVRCHSRIGHGPRSLDEALIESCNAYFAALGESLDTADYHALAYAFGFGRETGVRNPPGWDDGLRTRLGLVEDVPLLFRSRRSRSGELDDFQRRLAGNGLGLVEATPMQMARATAGLATGVLPSMRLVRRVGDRLLAPGPRERVSISSASLARVRAAMVGVTHSPAGTASRALGPHSGALGFRIAAKTGSADLTSRKRGDDDVAKNVVRKHTWVIGWAPAEDPEVVFAVFVHDTNATSSHGAVYLTRQFLQQPEVLAWLETRDLIFGAPR